MIDAEHCQAFAAYNGWMNRKIYEAASQLTDAERKAAKTGADHDCCLHFLNPQMARMARMTGTGGFPVKMRALSNRVD